MKKVAIILFSLIRWIVILSAILVIFEAIYFHTTGNYFIYYKLMLRKADNGAEQIHIINEVFNVKRDWLANYFSNYFLPTVMGLSLIISAFDVGCLIYRGKRQTVMCILNIISFLVILYITLLY